MRLTLLFLAPLSLIGQTTVEGRVLDSATRTGVGGVRLRLLSKPAEYEALTDASGGFRLAAVTSGIYQVVFTAQDYDTETIRSRTIRVAPAGITTLTLELEPWASLSGRVADPEGKALGQAHVYLRGGANPAASAISEADGSFLFQHLKAGVYTLSARPPLGKSEASTGEKTGTGFVAPTATSRLEVVETFFPNAVDQTQAAQIRLRPGTKSDGNNVRLQLARVFSVRGVAKDSLGKPLPNAKVMIGKSRLAEALPGSLGDIGFFQPGGQTLNPDAEDTESVTSSNDGSFEFPKVRDGDWLLQAESEYVRLEDTGQDVQQVGFATIRVSGRDLEGVELLLSKTFDFTIQVTVDGVDKPERDTFASLLLQPVGPGRYSFGMQENDRFGAIRFSQVIPGRYIVIPGFSGSLNGLHIMSIRLGDLDVTGKPVDLTEDSSPMRAILMAGGGPIRGTLSGGPGVVLAIPQADAADPTITYIQAEADAQFEIPNVAPGTYAVVAFDHVEGQAIFDPATLARLRTLGTAAHVEKGGTASIVNLRLHPWLE